jgi:lipopolysaccharide export LptBFGC system permease protein LptF
MGTSLSRRGELIAMYAGGVRPFTIFLPVLILTSAMAIGVFVLSDQVHPRCVQKLDEIKRNDLGRWTWAAALFTRQRHWYRVGDTLVRIADVDKKNNTYYGMTLLEMDKGRVRRRIYADRVLALSNQFQASDVVIETYGVAPEAREGTAEQAAMLVEQRPQFDLPLPPRFNAFLDISAKPQTMGISELERVFKVRRRQGYNPSLYEVEYYARIGNPAIIVVLMFVAMTYALRADVKRSLIRSGLEMLALLGFGFGVQQVFRSLAIAQVVSAQMSAFGPLLTVLALGLYRSRRWIEPLLPWRHAATSG